MWGTGIKMKDFEKVKEKLAKKHISYTLAASPRSDLESALKFRKLCEMNKCGTYNASWTCPPAVGKPEDCVKRLEDFEKALIVTNTFRDLDMNDFEGMKKMMKSHQDLCRDVKKMFQKEGFEELTLTDGACTYCKKCTYPDRECKHPGMKVPSVSGFGIDMSEYIHSAGLEFEFKKDEATLYGLILFK